MAQALKRGLRPTHPGAFIRIEILDELGLSISKAARHLGVRTATLSDLVNEKSALSPEMAMRIELAFDVKADLLLRMQAMRDAYLAHEKASTLKVRRYEPTGG